MLTRVHLIVIAVAGIALMALFSHVTKKMKLADDLVAVTRVAVGDPDLKPKRAVDAIEALGRDRAALIRVKAQLEDEARQSAQLKADARKAASQAQGRAWGMEGARQAYERSSRAGGPIPADCEASKAVQERWR